MIEEMYCDVRCCRSRWLAHPSPYVRLREGARPTELADLSCDGRHVPDAERARLGAVGEGHQKTSELGVAVLRHQPLDVIAPVPAAPFMTNPTKT